MKKQFQSKSVPRGTRTLWRYLGALILFFSLSIDQMWAAEIFSTDVLASVSSATVSQNKGAYTTGTATSWSDPYENYFATSGSAGYYQLAFSTPISLTGYTDVKVNVYWGTTSNRPLNMTINDGSATKIDEVTASADRSKLRVAEGAVSVSSISSLKLSSSGGGGVHLFRIEIVGTPSGGGGGDPVDPEFTYTPATYTIGDPALDLSTKLTSTNTTGAITFAIKDAAGTGATIANSKNFIATTVGTAKVTVTQAASTGYNAKSQDIDVTVAAPDPCTTYFHFVATADATANGKTNWDGFTNAPTGSNGQSNSVTIDGSNYTLTKRTGSTGGGGTILGFTIPANKAGTLYGYMKSSGTGARILSLKKGDDVVKTNTEITDGNWTLITISAIAPGTYTLSPDQNVQIQMFALKVCDATFHTITLDLDGGTGATSIQALDGVPATKPADPTKEHCAFAGWVVKSTSAAYDWAANVTGDLTLKATWTQLYTVTFANGGGSGDAPAAVADKAQGETFAVPANTFTAPEGKEFDKWNDGSADYAPGDTYTVGTDNVVLTAVWKQLVAKYTVVFKDGETELGTKLFDVASNPSDADINKTKPLFTFAAWQKDEADIALDDAFWATVVKDATVTLTARWEKLYATSVDFEAFIDAQGTSGNWQNYLSEHGYAISSSSDVSLDGGDSGNKPADKGLKIKKANRTITFEVVADKVVVQKVGSLKGGAQIKVNEGEYADLTGASPLSTGASVFSYYYSANVATYTIKTSADDYNIIQSITIRAPYQVTFDANGGEDVASLNGTPSVTLPSATKGTDSFLGWFDAAEGGNKIGEAGASYTPTADIELFAHWEAVSTDARLASITFSSAAGTLSPAFDPEVTSYTYTMPYGTAAIPTITGATSVNAKAKAPVIDAQAANWGDVAHIHGVAQSDDTKDYYITMLQAPKDGVEIIGVVTTGGNNKTVSGLYKGDATVNLDGDKKIGGGKYIYVTLASGYTFEETDVLVVDVNKKSDLPSSPALEITTGVGNIDGAIWKSIANADYELHLVTIPLTGIAANQTSIGLKRSDHQNTWVNGLKVYRPMMPMLTAITINGVDCEKGTGNAYSVTLPEATTDLAALTVVPTIVWNAAATENSIVVNNGGAWHEGANSYKLTDKDGDATTYTITITLQGEAPAPVIATQPAGVAYCAGSEPTLEVVATGDELHYAWFKEAGETDEAVGTDLASYTVEAAGTYYVIVTNHVDGKLDKSITSANAVVTLNTAAAITKQPVNKRDIVSGASVTLSVEATNATGYQWYICDDAEKANASAISGADAANYVFNCSANAFYYCVVGNACGADIESNVVSVKLEPVGCNVLDGTIPSAAPYIYDNGEWTLYAVTSGGKLDGTSRFDDDAKDFDGNTVNAITYGRVGMTFAKDVESLTIYATSSSSDRAISSIKVTTDDVTTGTPSYSDVTFTASAEKLGKKDSSSPYRFVLEANNMLLEAGKKYWLQFSGTVSAFKICYSEALAMPALPTLVNQELCAGAAYQEFDATITNEAACEGTVSYKWFSTADTGTPVATTAEFTPTAEGTYYVVVTHAKAGHITRTAQSANLSVAHFDALTLVSHSDDVFQHMGTAATLSVVATGKNVAYVWYTCSNAAGDDAVAIDPAETEASLAIASIAEGVQYYKVVISHDCDATTLSHVFKVEGWDQLEQVDVTETTTWNMANSAENAIDLSKAPYSCQNELLLLANIDGVNNNTTFNAQALKFEGQHICRTQNEVKHLAGRYLQFNVTKSGYVSVTFASNGSNARTVKVNGLKCQETSNSGATYKTFVTFVQPGSVEIIGMEGNSEKQYVRISEVKFTVKETPDYTRNVSNNIGTLCVDHNVVAGGALGATFYQIASRNEQYNDKIDFEEVLPNEELKAGEPYIFQSTTGRIDLFYGETVADDPVAVRGMIGNYAASTLAINEDNQHTILYIAENKIWSCENIVGSTLKLNPNRAYINMELVPTYAEYQEAQTSNPAPRRRVTLGKNAEQVVTGVENLNASEQPVKLLINGQIFILRGEKMFDATGRLVK